MLHGVELLLKRSLRGALALHHRWTNATNVKWHSVFAEVIFTWCIGPKPSVQLGGQMPRMLNGA
jgi:hypothetical protein